MSVHVCMLMYMCLLHAHLFARGWHMIVKACVCVCSAWIGSTNSDPVICGPTVFTSSMPVGCQTNNQT